MFSQTVYIKSVLNISFSKSAINFDYTPFLNNLKQLYDKICLYFTLKLI